MNTRRLSALALALAVCLHVAFPPTHLKLLMRLPLCLQLGESLEEQLGQRLLRMPPPPQLPPRVRQGQQHMIEQQQQPSMFQLPYEVPPVLTDPMQVCGVQMGRVLQQHGRRFLGLAAFWFSS